MRPSVNFDATGLKLVDVSVRADGLMLPQDVFDFLPVEDEVIERPIHDELVSERRLKIALREGQYLVKRASEEPS